MLSQKEKKNRSLYILETEAAKRCAWTFTSMNSLIFWLNWTYCLLPVPMNVWTRSFWCLWTHAFSV